ncbi:MAG: hypothetical protein LBR99_02640 [Treponema sp.]|nr:hypothetical protein [Treponema sp.]
MKKALVFGMFFGLVFAGFVFGADTYAVQDISGKVDKLGPSGQWVAVSVGDTLSPLTMVKIGLNAVLVVKSGDDVEVIRSARQGTLESFLGAGRISGEGNVINSNVSVPVFGTSDISTSSVRTGDAASHLDWAE